MDKKWAFVTGISEGIGKSVALRLEKNGYNVLGISRTEPKYLSDHPNIYWFQLDLSETLNKDEFLTKVKSHTKSISIVVLNAAQAHYGKVLDMDDDLLLKMININLLTSIHIIKTLIQIMESGGHVVLVGSSGAYFPAPNNALYAAIKAAQGHLAMSLNVEHLKENIKFKVCRPGFTATPMAERTGRPEKLSGTEWFWNMTPDHVANDIIKLTRSKRFMINSGWVSKLMSIFSRISPKLCLFISIQRHKRYL